MSFKCIVESENHFSIFDSLLILNLLILKLDYILEASYLDIKN